MIIVCLVVVAAALIVIGAALVLAELTLVYVGLGLALVSTVLTAVEFVRSRGRLFGAQAPAGVPPVAGSVAVPTVSTDALGKAPVNVAASVPSPRASVPPAPVAGTPSWEPPIWEAAAGTDEPRLDERDDTDRTHEARQENDEGPQVPEPGPPGGAVPAESPPDAVVGVGVPEAYGEPGDPETADEADAVVPQPGDEDVTVATATYTEPATDTDTTATADTALVTNTALAANDVSGTVEEPADEVAVTGEEHDVVSATDDVPTEDNVPTEDDESSTGTVAEDGDDDYSYGITWEDLPATPEEPAQESEPAPGPDHEESSAALFSAEVDLSTWVSASDTPAETSEAAETPLPDTPDTPDTSDTPPTDTADDIDNQVTDGHGSGPEEDPTPATPPTASTEVAEVPDPDPAAADPDDEPAAEDAGGDQPEQPEREETTGADPVVLDADPPLKPEPADAEHTDTEIVVAIDTGVTTAPEVAAHDIEDDPEVTPGDGPERAEAPEDDEAGSPDDVTTAAFSRDTFRPVAERQPAEDR